MAKPALEQVRFALHYRRPMPRAAKPAVELLRLTRRRAGVVVSTAKLVQISSHANRNSKSPARCAALLFRRIARLPETLDRADNDQRKWVPVTSRKNAKTPLPMYWNEERKTKAGRPAG